MTATETTGQHLADRLTKTMRSQSQVEEKQ